MTKRKPSGRAVCWCVEISGLRCYVFTDTKPRAQWLATKGYWGAYGRRRGEWPRASASRCPAHDSSVWASLPPKPLSYDQL